MESLSFSASRFKVPRASNQSNSDGVESSNIGDQSDSNNTHIDKYVKSSVNDHYDLLLLDSEHYSISQNNNLQLPKLDDNESILAFKVASDSIAIMTTSSRILVYSSNSRGYQPFTFEFEYSSNSSGIAPLSAIIPNPINPLKPDLVIIDSLSGEIQFFEAIKLSPTLSALQNHLKSHIHLHSSEFLTNIQLFEDNSVFITTSQNRIIYVTFKDQFGNISINLHEIYNNRPIISFILSKSYSLREYSKSNHIVSIKSVEISPFSKRIIILESSGRTAFLNYIKGSTHFTLEKIYNLDMVPPLSGMVFWDFEFVQSKQLGVVLAFNTESKELSTLFLAFDQSSGPNLVHKYDLSSIFFGEKIATPRLYTLENTPCLAVKNNNKFLVFDPNYDGFPSPWKELIVLKPYLKVYSITKDSTSQNSLYLASDEGIFRYNLKSFGTTANIDSYIRNHIIQFLVHFKDGSPVAFDLNESSMAIPRERIEHAISLVLDDLLENRVHYIDQNLLTSKYLNTKLDLVKKLAVYTSENYPIENDPQLQQKILNTSALLSLSEKFYDLINESETEGILTTILASMSYSGSLNDFFKFRSKNILTLIFNYITEINGNSNESDIKKLAFMLKGLFIDAYVKLDDDIRKILGDRGFSSIFIEHSKLFESIHGLIMEVYKMLDISADPSSSTKTGEVLVGLSFFLYYTINEIVMHLSISLPNDCSDSILRNYGKFLSCNKSKWIHGFIRMNKQDDLIPLVNKYKDYSSLSLLLDSKRITALKLFEDGDITEIEYANLLTDIELEFDMYIETYGYDFCKCLFNYYVSTNKISVLLTFFEKHGHFMEKFLSSETELYKLAWIHDIMSNKIERVGGKIAALISQENDVALPKKKLRLSIGKLSTLCASNESVTVGTQVDEYNTGLKLVGIQETIAEFLKQPGIFSASDGKIIESHSLGMGYLDFADEIKRISDKLQKNIALSVTEIIQFTTLASFSNKDPKSNAESTEENARFGAGIINDFLISTFKDVMSMLQSYSEFKEYSNPAVSNKSVGESYKVTIWVRLILRRLYLRSEYKSVLEHVLGYMNENGISGNLSKPFLTLTQADLLQIGISNSLLTDFEKENALL